jgi:hypothetical protein
MCAKSKSVTASRCEDVSEDKTSSPVPGNTIRSGYRVLGERPRGRLLSVDRNCASRKALSGLKVSSPDKHLISVVAMRVLRSEATPKWNLESPRGTTGVQVHGEYRRVLLKLGRSPRGRQGNVQFDGQEFNIKSKIIPLGEVRWVRSSGEVG